MGQDWLILDTSGRVGRVGLARADGLLAEITLDENRKHARDLSSTIQTLCQNHRVPIKELSGIMATVGPGSYTGLRVGLATAKVLAYALNIPLIPVPTFHAIAKDLDRFETMVVIADALKGHAYVQEFVMHGGTRSPAGALRIVKWADYMATHTPAAIAGPGVDAFRASMPEGCQILSRHGPSCAGVFAAGRKITPCTEAELFALEPLYLRGSSAEEQWKALGRM